MKHESPLTGRSLAIERGLDRALAAGHLQLAYQPQSRIEHPSFLAMEALCRWTDPDWGPISPMEFISVAEASGQIIALDHWVIRQVLIDLPLLLERYPRIRVAMNVSACELMEPAFWPLLNAQLDAAGIDKVHHLEFEITESVQIQGDETLAQHLTALRDRGVTLALDDFGTGYSSLSRLHRMDFDKIKLDKQFVHSLHEPRARAIVQAICTLADDLNVPLVAEGVETTLQREQLKTLGCRFIQGYLCARPRPLAHWLNPSATH